MPRWPEKNEQRKHDLLTQVRKVLLDDSRSMIQIGYDMRQRGYWITTEALRIVSMRVEGNGISEDKLGMILRYYGKG